MSGTGWFPRLVYEQVLKHVQNCSITHLYMERCFLIPRITYDNLRIEFVSVAGLRDHEHPTVLAFDCIRNWAALPSLKDMNASGCQMSQAQREQLVTDHQNVTFNISVEFQESPRVEFWYFDPSSYLRVCDSILSRSPCFFIFRFFPFSLAHNQRKGSMCYDDFITTGKRERTSRELLRKNHSVNCSSSTLCLIQFMCWFNCHHFSIWIFCRFSCVNIFPSLRRKSTAFVFLYSEWCSVHMFHLFVSSGVPGSLLIYIVVCFLFPDFPRHITNLGFIFSIFFRKC